MTTRRIALAGLLATLLIGGIAVSAFTQKQKTKSAGRRYINLPGRNINAPFSDGVLIGDTLYLAGRLGIDPKTSQIPDDIEQEARFMLDGFKAVLAEAGMTMDNMVTVTVYCPDLTLFDRFNKVYRTYYSRDFPARAFIGSGPLLRGAHFEIQGIASRN